MRWQSVVRIVLALAFVGVGALGIWLKAWPVAPAQNAVAPLSNQQAVSQRESGTFQHFDEAGALVYTIAFERHETFADNRNVFERATTTFLRNGVRHTIVADRAEMLGRAGPTGNQPERIVFPSGVRMSADGGVEVEADGEATYFNVEQKVVVPGPMRFTRGRLSGSGVGADLYMDRSVLWINDQAALSVAPEVAAGYSSCIVEDVQGIRTIMTLTARAGIGVRAAGRNADVALREGREPHSQHRHSDIPQRQDFLHVGVQHRLCPSALDG